MIDAKRIASVLAQEGMAVWAKHIERQLRSVLNGQRHGDWGRWRYIVETLPKVATSDVDLNADCVRIGRAENLDNDTHVALLQGLRALQPWRKGPYCIYGIHIDTEWRSDWKWRRLWPHIQPLRGRRVLDVGCGNGYHCWRMAGAGARLVLGIDPNLLFLSQFLAVRTLMAVAPPVMLLPLGIEAVPERLQAFDTVFSMGVLYHRRSPIEHLLALRDCLRPGGELVLETLVVQGDAQTVLVPKGRYAKMRNIWFIPAVDALHVWMQRCGFQDIRLVDLSPTTVNEQRRTPWMAFESLSDFLDPQDRTRTIEGYPAPLRAILIARR